MKENQKNGNLTDNTANPTEKLLNEVEVKEVVEVKQKKKAGVTAKTLGALTEQMRRVKEDNLLNIEEMQQMTILMTTIRLKWIEKNL